MLQVGHSNVVEIYSPTIKTSFTEFVKVGIFLRAGQVDIFP